MATKGDRGDGVQRVAAPDMDRPDRQSGDRIATETAQRAVPIPKSNVPEATPRAISGAPSLEQMRGGGLADFVLGQPSTRPEEPMTSGMNMGPGMGMEALANPPQTEDEFEQLLEYMVRNYQDADSAQALAEMRGGAAGSQPSLPADPLAAPPAEPEMPMDLGEEAFLDFEYEEDLGPATSEEEASFATGEPTAVEGGEPAEAPAPTEPAVAE